MHICIFHCHINNWNWFQSILLNIIVATVIFRTSSILSGKIGQLLNAFIYLLGKRLTEAIQRFSIVFQTLCHYALNALWTFIRTIDFCQFKFTYPCVYLKLENTMAKLFAVYQCIKLFALWKQPNKLNRI